MPSFIHICFSVVFFLQCLTISLSVAEETPGRTQAEFNVNVNGAATYSIPIWVTPGRNGVEPDLSLNYNSQGGVGLLGEGWSLNGVSALRRVAPNPVYDNVRGGITCTVNDRFSYNGSRLKVVRGEHSRSGSEYRKIKDDYMRFLAHGQHGSAPSYFIGYEKSGTRIFLGSTSDSKLLHRHKNEPMRWMVSKIVDVHGNEIKYSYTNDRSNGLTLPSRIDYTGKNGSGYFASVRFTYGNRPYPRLQYVSGSNVYNHKRLTRVEVYNGTAKVRSYVISYRDTNELRHSEISKVQEYGRGVNPFKPIIFSYDTSGHLGFSRRSNKTIPDSSGSMRYISYSRKERDEGITRTRNTYSTYSYKVYRHLADFNNDGYTDVFWFRTDGANKIYINNKNGGWATWNNPLGGFDASVKVLQYKKSAPGRNEPYSYYAPFACSVFVKDYNNDGWADIFVTTNGQVPHAFLINKGDGTFFRHGGVFPDNKYRIKTFDVDVNEERDERKEVIKLPGEMIHGDWDGDGRKDVAFRDPQSGKTNFFRLNGDFAKPVHLNPNFDSSWLRGEDVRVYPGDFNRDRLTDLLSYNKDNGDIKILFGTGGAKFSRKDAGFNMNDDDGKAQVTIRDMNGDGLSDFVWWRHKDGKNYLCIYNGDVNTPTFHRYRNAIPDSPIDSSNNPVLKFADMNGDGLTDAYFFKTGDSGTNRLFLNRGNMTFTMKTDLLPKSKVRYTNDHRLNTADGTLLDFDGDGMRDLVGFKSESHYYVNQSGNRELKRIENNYVQHVVNYASLTNSDIHIRDQKKRSYPKKAYVGAVQVVSSHQESDGRGGMRKKSYSYSNATSYVDGHGYLGFLFRKVCDHASGLEHRYYYTMDWWHRNRLTKQTLVHTETGKALEKTFYKLALRKIFGGKIYWGHRVGIDKEEREFTNDKMVKWMTREFTYDTFGSVLTEKQRVYGGGKTRLCYSTDITNDFYNDTDLWRIGREKETIITSTTPGSPTITVKRKSTWDESMARKLTYEVVSNDKHIKIKTIYSYDLFGNIISESKQAWDGVTVVDRVFTRQYNGAGRYVLKEIDQEGNITQFDYDYGLGVPNKHIDPHGLVTTTEYDIFGRPIKVLAPATITNISRIQIAGELVTRTETLGRPVTVEVLDILGRVISQGSVAFDGSVSYIDTAYTQDGQLSWRTEPYREQENPSIYRTNFKYDEARRLIEEILPNSANRTIGYGTNDNGYERLIRRVDELGKMTREYQDACGRTIRIHDAASKVLHYDYDSNNKLIKVIAPDNVETHMIYDILGRRIRLDDPNAGIEHYVFNGFGERISKVDARGIQTQYRFDKLGRKIQAIRPEGVDQWIYDKNRLHHEKAASGFNTEYRYTKRGLNHKTLETNGSEQFVVSRLYDEHWRVRTETYPSGYTVRYAYNDYGYLRMVRDDETDDILWECHAKNARGQNTKIGHSQNRLITNYSYDSRRGWMKQAHLGSFANYTWNYDVLGNLTVRRDVKRNLEEFFTYDMNHRLTSSRVGSEHINVNYDAAGNILMRSDIGHLKYLDPNKPYAVSRVDQGSSSTHFSYDASGNMLSWNDSCSATYNSAGNIIEMINTADTTRRTIHFDLDANQQRKMQTVRRSNGSIFETTRYVGKLYECVKRGDEIVHIHYVRHDGGTFGIRKTGKHNSMRYILRDHLGSLTAIYDHTGLKEVLSYTPWGMRRNGNNWRNEFVAAKDKFGMAAGTDRGFTGHEHFDTFKMVHMNGRTYLPGLGRFMQPDPIVKNPKSLQHYNRYSYVLNRPLNYTDPSGFQVTGSPGHNSGNPNHVDSDVDNNDSSDEHDQTETEEIDGTADASTPDARRRQPAGSSGGQSSTGNGQRRGELRTQTESVLRPGEDIKVKPDGLKNGSLQGYGRYGTGGAGLGIDVKPSALKREKKIDMDIPVPGPVTASIAGTGYGQVTTTRTQTHVTGCLRAEVKLGVGFDNIGNNADLTGGGYANVAGCGELTIDRDGTMTTSGDMTISAGLYAEAGPLEYKAQLFSSEMQGGQTWDDIVDGEFGY